MSVSEPRPGIARRVENIAVWSLIVVLGLLFAALTVYQVLGRDRSVVNEERLKELAVANLAKVAGTAQSRDLWPQWRGPNRDGVSLETGLLAEWPEEGLRVLWSQKIGIGYSSVAVAAHPWGAGPWLADLVFTMAQDNGEEEILWWYSGTGERMGRHAYPAKFTHPYGGGPRSTPSIYNSRVYTVGATGILTCLTVQKIGKGEYALAWTKDLASEFGSRKLEWGVASSPLIDQGYVFIMPGGPDGNAIAALNPDDGSVIWKKFDDLPSYSSPVAADIGGRRHIIFLTGERLIGVDPHTGNLLWETPWGSTKASHAPTNITTPLVIPTDIGVYVFLSSGYDKGCALFKIEKDGDRFQAEPVYHNRNMRSTFCTCVRWGDYLYGFDDVHLKCLEWRTGKAKWKEYGFGKGSVTIADGKLIILSDDGTLALADADPAGYHERSRFVHSEQPSSWTVPVVAGGRLYVRDKTRLVCYDLKKKI